MEKFIQLFEEYVMKAITITEKVLEADLEKMKIEEFTMNRERLFHIIEQMSEQINWESVHISKRKDLDRQIEYIKSLDEKLIIKLQVYQEEIRKDIEKNFRQKENIKGYNLNDVK